MYSKHITEFISKQENVAALNPKKIMAVIRPITQSTLARSNDESCCISAPVITLQVLTQSTPGPGAHNPARIEKPMTKSKAQLGGNGGRAKLFETRKGHQTPGPGGYANDSKRNLKSAPSASIGKSQRRPLIEGTPLTTPPPGSYEYKSKILEMPGIKFKGSSYDPVMKEKKKIPGLGLYDPKPQYKQRPVTVRIGTSQRHDFTKNTQNLPPPGAYTPILKPVTPSFGFGTSKRPPLERKTDAPGPGTHPLKSTFADVPAYVRDHKIQH